MRTLLWFFFISALLTSSVATQSPVNIKPTIVTEAVEHDADDPAIWINQRNPDQSLILGTDKGTGENSGALYVFGLDGKIRQKITGLKKPNNVDVEYGFKLGNKRIDIAVLTEANAKRLRIYEISSTGKLTEITGSAQTKGTPWGIGLYKNPLDGIIYAIVSLSISSEKYLLAQYLLKHNDSGKIDAIEIRQFGNFSGKDCIEAVAIDDELGYVYYADESYGIRKYHANPKHPNANSELACFGISEFELDREGIAIYNLQNGKGYVICTDQKKNSRYLIYPREGTPGKPHEHGKAIKIIEGNANATDGIEVVSAYLGPKFPNGVLVVMNSRGRNFFIYDWRDVATVGKPKLKINFTKLSSQKAN